MNNAVSYIFIAIFIAGPTILFTDLPIYLPISVAIFLIVFGILKPASEPSVYIDKNQREVSPSGDEWFSINDDTRIILTRSFRKSSGSESSNTSYVANWDLKLENTETVTLQEHKVSKKSSTNSELYNVPWMGEMGKTIVSEVGGVYVDHTGIESSIQEEEDVSKYLYEKLREKGVEPFTGKVPEAVKENFKVSHSGSEVSLADKGINGKLKTVFIALVALGLYGLYSLIPHPVTLDGIDTSNYFDIFFQLFWLFFVFVAAISVILYPHSNQIKLEHGRIKMRKKQIIGSRNTSTMPIRQLRSIQIIKPFRNTGIELVGEHHRFALVGGLSDEEADILIDFLDHVIVSQI